MTQSIDLFPGFATRRIATPSGEIFARVGGSGPPLLLMHGYPQTHVCWHKIAPQLAEHVTLVLPDLRGYGASHCPPGDAEHLLYSKRAMAAEMREVMRGLGHERFMVGGHDRGGRVAYRLALDHPEAVTACLPIDILPTAEMWARMRAPQAIGSYHWAFLAQPSPMPETLIGADPAFYVRHTLSSWTADKTLNCFDPAALAAYETALMPRERIHAVCEDYRAGATFDRVLDEQDRAEGRLIKCPTYFLWGSDYIGKGHAAPLDVWRTWADNVEGQEISSGHFLAEENPAGTAAALIGFIVSQAKG
jgi:haloacetate dehalogenase